MKEYIDKWKLKERIVNEWEYDPINGLFSHEVVDTLMHIIDLMETIDVDCCKDCIYRKSRLKTRYNPPAKYDWFVPKETQCNMEGF